MITDRKQMQFTTFDIIGFLSQYIVTSVVESREKFDHQANPDYVYSVWGIL